MVRQLPTIEKNGGNEMKKLIVLAAVAMMALPAAAFAAGLSGDCYDCHTMHAQEEGKNVVRMGAGANILEEWTGTPIVNLLKFDCMACHANNPTGGTKTMNLTGGSTVPQVAHGGTTLADSLAGGNFSFGMAAQGGTSRNVHNVNDLFAGQVDNNTGLFNEPPGLYHGEDRHAFTTSGGAAFDAFTCAGARGCHGTRDQILDIAVDNGTANVYGAAKRVGIAAVSGAHHINIDGAKDATNYTGPVTHSGAKVAEGYRFIVGLKGMGNTEARWQNVDAGSHNEYYGVAGGLAANSCGTCHINRTVARLGDSSRLGIDSTIITPNNSMSGFCSSCHSNFHSGGSGGDTVNNGVSGAFLRHPSDYVIKNEGEYGLYTSYDVTAPVARPTLAASVSDAVNPGTDMVMCLSCHVSHGSPYDYLLRFDYAAMSAGTFADAATAQAEGGCMACHGNKGIAR
jgi:predicted CXXCH cytochrome family protein